MLCGAAALIFAQPAWWAARGVIVPGKSPDDFAVLNQGQLKNLARAARDELDAHLPGGAGQAINNLVESWSTADAQAANYAAVNAGQLKALGAQFHDRLAKVGFANPGVYPWTDGTAAADDFAPVNIGQAKSVFSFDVAADSDHDGIPDMWEVTHGMNPQNANDASLDGDHDGLSNLAEFQHLTNPNAADSDGDGVSDAQEIAEGTDALDARSNSETLLGLKVFTRLTRRFE